MRRISMCVVLSTLLASPSPVFPRQRTPPPVTKSEKKPPQPTVEQLNQQYRKANLLHAAADAYRNGEPESALRLLDLLPYNEQLGIVQGVLLELRTERDIRRSGKQTFRPSWVIQATVKKLPWDVSLVRALAALEMEALLHAYRSRVAGIPSVYPEAYQKAGEALFGFIEEEPGETYVGARWELALALRMLADGELVWARAVLNTPCRDPNGDGELLLACATADEVFTMQPAHLIMAPVRRSEPSKVPRMGVPINQPLETNRYGISESIIGSTTPIPHDVRDFYLKRAGAALEGLLRVAPTNAEAAVRLAHVRILQGKDNAATPLLLDVLSAAMKPDERVGYVAALFLAGVRERAGETQTAVSLLHDALRRHPDGQSALIALAEAQRRLGDTEAMTATVQRILTLPETSADPWWDYWAGQYWRAEPLLAELRAEARR